MAADAPGGGRYHGCCGARVGLTTVSKGVYYDCRQGQNDGNSRSKEVFMAVNGIAAWNMWGGTINADWTWSHTFNVGPSNIFAHVSLNEVGETSDQSTTWLYVEGFQLAGQLPQSGLKSQAAFPNNPVPVTYWLDVQNPYAIAPPPSL